MGKDFLYNEIANGIAGQIRNGVLKSGDRLPSVRTLCQEHSIGMNTAKRVFMELEAQSLIDSSHNQAILYGHSSTGNYHSLK
jgi:DNA-binding transcriptional regulator YhcF (GntR family)